MKIDFKTWIILGLTVIVILLILFQPSPLPPDTTAWQDEIHRTNEKTKELALQNQALLSRMASDSVSHHKKNDSLKTQANAYKSQVERLKTNPIVIKVREDTPEVDSLIIAQDSIIHTLEAQHYINSKYISTLQADVGRITANFEERLQLSQEAFIAQKAISDSYQKDNRKLRRTTRIFKALAVVGTVGGLILGSQ